MDCDLARLLLPYRRAKLGTVELDPGDSEALEAHLADCTACSSRAAAQERIDRILGKAMRTIEVPSGLADRIGVRLANERGARSRRWLFQAVAAAILLGLGISLAVTLSRGWLRTGDTLDLSAIPPPPRSPQSAGELPGWFWQNHGLDVQLPSALANRWDFGLLTSAHVAEIQGHAVPVLEFRKGEAHARVLLLRQGQFQPTQLQDYQQSPYEEAPRVLGQVGADRYVALALFSAGSKESEFLHVARPQT